jgi:hypothetical protein
MSGALDTPGYREAHDQVFYRLDRIRGLVYGLDDVMDGLPELVADTPTAKAIRAITEAIGDQAEAALAEHQSQWNATKGPAQAAG